MSAFVIGDLHLSFGVNKPMDIFKGWENYMELLFKSWQSAVKKEDTVIVCGDISWAMNLEELLPDFTFLEQLNGRKIILKGNHDYWWQTIKKLNEFLEFRKFKSIEFLHNNCSTAENHAICGTRGWLLEGKTESADDLKIISRECQRLETSLKQGRKTGLPVKAFLHYPPVYDNFECEKIIDLLNEYEVKDCYYGHIHGLGAKYAVCGEYRGINFRLIAADFLKFQPLRIF